MYVKFRAKEQPVLLTHSMAQSLERHQSSMKKLLEKNCIPCEGGVAPLTKGESEKFLVELEGWELSKNGKTIEKTFAFANFDKAMDFVNMVADTAEFEGHHPDIDIRYNTVALSLTTHSIKGLSENDFILAAKIGSIRL